MTQTQTQKLDQFSDDLRARLANIDSGLKSLKTKLGPDATQAEAEARRQLAQVSADIEASKPKLAAAEAQMTQWVQAQKAATTQKVAEWEGQPGLQPAAGARRSGGALRSGGTRCRRRRPQRRPPGCARSLPGE